MSKRKAYDAHEDEQATKKIRLAGKVSSTSEELASFSSLPLEIITECIKYFDLKFWLISLVLVCKRWKLAAQMSTEPKQLILTKTGDVSALCSALANYNVTTLVIATSIADVQTLSRIINAAPKLNTLVYNSSVADYHDWTQTINGCPCEISFNNITTLSIINLRLLNLFPNVTRLKIDLRGEYDGFSEVYPNVRELELQAETSEVLERITEMFPGLKTIYLNNYYYFTTQEIDDVSEYLGIPIICCRNGEDYAKMSYIDCFNALGQTQLFYFINQNNVKKVEELLVTNATNQTYEQDLFKRDPQFKFPSRNAVFMTSVLQNLGRSLTDEMFNTLMKHQGVNYWTALAAFDGRTEELLPLAKDFLPPPKEALTTVLSILSRVSVSRFLKLVGEKVSREFATMRDNNGNTFLHLLPWTTLVEYSDCTTLLEYSDIQALNNKQENAATIAFQSAHWDSWKKLVESGIAIQHDKYKEDINNAISFVELQQTGYISPRSLSYLKGTDFLQGLLFVDNLERPLCLELVKVVDFTKPNASGLSLVNQVILIDSWQVLANVNVNLDEFDTSGRTPLITALMQGNIECAKLLLEKGANPNAPGLASSGKKFFPVQVAAVLTSAAMINFLQSFGANFTVEDEDGNTVLNLAIAASTRAQSAALSALSMLAPINKPNCHNQTPLSLSISETSASLVNDCISCGADVNQLAGALLQSPLLMALEKGELYIVLSLLQTGQVDVTLKDKAGRSFVNYLLRREPPDLHQATKQFKFNYNIFAMNELLATIKDQYATPENIEFTRNEVLTILTTPEMSPLVTTLLKLAASDIGITTFFVKVLGIGVDTEDSNGDTMLSLMSYHSQHSPPVIDFLVSHGANINHQNKQKNTPLMKVMETIDRDKDREHVRLLLEHGASVEIQNIWGLSPRDVAHPSDNIN